MEQVTFANMMQSIVDRIFVGISGEEPTIPGESMGDAGKLMIVLEYPGNAVDPTDYDNPFGPSNPTGKESSLENLSLLMDDAPLVSSIKLTSSGQHIGFLYEQLVGNSHANQLRELTAEEKEIVKKAHDLIEDPNTLDDTPIYARYKKKQDEFNAARLEYFATLYGIDMNKPTDVAKWAAIGPTLRTKVTNAFNDYRAAHAAEIEKAQADISQLEEIGINKTFQDIRDKLQTVKRMGIISQTEYYPVKTLPGNWYSPDAPGFSHLIVTESDTKTVETSDFTKLNAHGGLFTGLFGHGQAGGYNSFDFSSSETKDFTMDFWFGRIEIRRPWLNSMIFGLKNWTSGVFNPGDISTGEKSFDNKGSMPLLPTAFIVVRNLKISAKWSQEDKTTIETNRSADGVFGCAFFAIGGGYNKGKKDTKIETQFDGTTLEVPGTQIIGWICSLVPFCPPKIEVPPPSPP